MSHVGNGCLTAQKKGKNTNTAGKGVEPMWAFSEPKYLEENRPP